MKLQEMMGCIFVKEKFGKVVAFVRVNDFQERGLRHAHCTFFLEKVSKYKLNNPQYVNTMIRAEIPPESDEELRKFVL